MQEIHNFLQRFLCFFLPGNILKCHSGLCLNVCFCTALADTHDSAAAFVHAPHEEHQHKEQDYCRKQYTDHCRNKLTHRVRLFIMKNNSCPFQTFRQSIDILHLIYFIACILIIWFLDLRYDGQYSWLKRNLLYLILIYHLNKFIIRDFTGRIAHHICHKT